MKWYKEGDEQLIVDALKLNGFEATLDDARALWAEYSKRAGERWICVGTKVETVAEIIRRSAYMTKSKQMLLIRLKGFATKLESEMANELREIIEDTLD